MKLKVSVLTLALAFSTTAWSQKKSKSLPPKAAPVVVAPEIPVQTETTTIETKPEADFIDHSRNYLQNGFNGGGNAPTAVNFRYYFRVHPQFLIGTGFSRANLTKGDKYGCNGDSSIGQCIGTYGYAKIDEIELNALFYFKEDGFKRWGFYLNPGVSYVKNEVGGNFNRYQKDNGFLCGIFFGGNCLTLVETGSAETKTKNYMSARLGAGYQFIWSPNLKISGHILDLGATLVMDGDRNEARVVQPNGEVKTYGADPTRLVASIAYIFVF